MMFNTGKKIEALRQEIERLESENKLLMDSERAAREQSIEARKQAGDAIKSCRKTEIERDKLRKMVISQKNVELLVNALEANGMIAAKSPDIDFHDRANLLDLQRQQARAMQNAYQSLGSMGALSDLGGIPR